MPAESKKSDPEPSSPPQNAREPEPTEAKTSDFEQAPAPAPTPNPTDDASPAPSSSRSSEQPPSSSRSSAGFTIFGTKPHEGMTVDLSRFEVDLEADGEKSHAAPDAPPAAPPPPHSEKALRAAAVAQVIGAKIGVVGYGIVRAAYWEELAGDLAALELPLKVEEIADAGGEFWASFSGRALYDLVLKYPLLAEMLGIEIPVEVRAAVTVGANLAVIVKRNDLPPLRKAKPARPGGAAFAIDVEDAEIVEDVDQGADDAPPPPPPTAHADIKHGWGQ